MPCSHRRGRWFRSLRRRPTARPRRRRANPASSGGKAPPRAAPKQPRRRSGELIGAEMAQGDVDYVARSCRLSVSQPRRPSFPQRTPTAEGSQPCPMASIEQTIRARVPPALATAGMRSDRSRPGRTALSRLSPQSSVPKRAALAGQDRARANVPLLNLPRRVGPPGAMTAVPTRTARRCRMG